MSTEIWEKFWFEGNQYFGWVTSSAEWEKVKQRYAKHAPHVDLSAAKRCDSANDPFKPIAKRHHKFGFATECKGEETLGEFFTSRLMKL